MHILYVIDTLKRGGKERRLMELIDNLPNDISFTILLLKNEIEFNSNKLQNNVYVYEGLNNKINKLFWFTKIILQLNPDIVHSWYHECSQFTLPICKLKSIKFITSEITNITPQYGNIWSKYIKLLIFRGANHITSNSIAGLDAYNAPREKSSVIYNGFNFNRIELIEDNTINKRFNNQIVVLMIANFTDKKDYTTFLNAAIEVHDLYDNIVFIGIGKGTKLDDFRKLIPEEMKKCILFPGFVENVEAYIKISDIGVLVSFGEGFPNSIMEFMAFSKPVVVSEGGGTNELIKDNFNGFLIPQNSKSALVEKLVRLIEDNNLRNELGKNAFDFLKENFSIDVMTKMFINRYKMILDI